MALASMELAVVQILALLGMLAFGAQPELWGLAWALVVLWAASSALADWLGQVRGVGNLPFKGSFGLGRLGGGAGDGDLVGRGWNGSYSVEAALGYGHLPNWQCHLWERRHEPHVLDVLRPGWWVLLWH